jgi:hypothetical protein
MSSEQEEVSDLMLGQEGSSCPVCHTAPGIGALSSTVSGERLVKFDVNVTAPNRGLPISYRQASDTCTLTCHNAAHNPDRSVSSTTSPEQPGVAE